MIQEERLDPQHGAANRAAQPSSMPPCCGTGCAVCILDYWIEDEFETPRQEAIAAVNCDHDRSNQPYSLPECCGTGCTVCVLDYPEYFSQQKSELEISAMLEAIEEAQRLAQQMVANQDGDLQ